MRMILERVETQQVLRRYLVDLAGNGSGTPCYERRILAYEEELMAGSGDGDTRETSATHPIMVRKTPFQRTVHEKAQRQHRGQ